MNWAPLRLLALALAWLLSGCAGQSTPAAPATTTSDGRTCQSIRSAMVARDPSALTVLHVLCSDDLVVIAGALPPDYTLAVAAVHIARKTPGVHRVETFFVPRSAREASDAALAVQVKSAVAGSDGTAGAGPNMTVIGGTVVLVGVVDDQAQADRLVASASAVSGVKSVKSFLQVKP